jgi:hypothetical protein
VVRVAWNNTQLSGLSSVKRLLSEEHTKIPASLYAAMAADAMFIQNRFNLRTKIHPVILAGHRAADETDYKQCSPQCFHYVIRITI